jgi:hypothetical protein
MSAPADRPGEGEEPTAVRFYAFVLDIDDINGAEQNFQANVFIRLRWKDKRLADKDKGVRTLPLQAIWNPRIIIANKQGIVRRSLPEVAEVKPDGTVTYMQRFVGPLSQPLRLSEFPFDKHDFTITFIAPGHSPDDVQFVPDAITEDTEATGGAMFETLSVADWEVTEYHAEPRPYEPMKGVKTAGFVFEFTAERYTLYYIWQVMVPLVLIVMMSWGAFWIDPTNASAQIGVATSSMLTLIAYRFMLGGLTPRLPYMTRLDYFTLGSTILVFLTLVEVIVTSILARNNREKLGRRMDYFARFAFPAFFAFWCTWTMIV